MTDYFNQSLTHITFSTGNDESVVFTGRQDGINYNVGDLVGESYRLIKQLGRGGMGVVYLAEHSIIGQRYALKLLAPDQVNAANWHRFEQEGRALARLNHENIVRIYNMGIDKRGCPFYVMDYIDGETLQERMQKQKSFLSVGETLAIYSLVLEGLASAHAANIVHRDIKPSNIMLAKEDAGKARVKLVDFGIARLSTAQDQGLTGKGEVFGSPPYMSPEQCMGGLIDQRSDIYSLGCALFHTLTGRPPFYGASAMATVLLQQSAPAPTLSEVAGEDFGELEVLLSRMLEKEPAKRYQTTEQVLHDMNRLSSGKTLARVVPRAAEATTVEETSPKKADRSKLLLAVPLALILLTCGIVAYLALLPRPVSKKKPPPLEDLHYEKSILPARINNDSARFTDNFKLNEMAHDIAGSRYLTGSNKLADVDELHMDLSAVKKAAKIPVRVSGRGNNRVYHIVFPEQFSMGQIEWVVNGTRLRKSARGEVLVPVNAAANIELNNDIAVEPAFLDKLMPLNFVYVRLSECNISDNQLLGRLAHFPSLRELRLSQCEVKADALKYLEQFTAINKFAINSCSLDSTRLASLKVWDRFYEIDLRGISDAEPLIVRATKAKSCTHLILSQLDVPDRLFKNVGAMPILESVVLRKRKLSGDNLKDVMKAPRLEYINIECEDLSDEDLLILAQKPLKRLTISIPRKVSPDVVARLKAKTPNLAFVGDE